MRGLATLSTRLKRIEARHRPRRQRRPILYTIYNAPEAIGVAVGRETFDRRPGEAMEELVARAAAQHPRKLLTTLYGPSWAPRDEAPSAWSLRVAEAARLAAEPITMPVAPDMGGIGVTAPDDVLRRHGVIDNPVERML